MDDTDATFELLDKIRLLVTEERDSTVVLGALGLAAATCSRSVGLNKVDFLSLCEKAWAATFDPAVDKPEAEA